MLGLGRDREEEIMQQQMTLQEQQVGLQAAASFSDSFDREYMKDILSYTLDNTSLLEKIEHQLRGETLVLKNGSYEWYQTGDPFMREEKGITDFINFLDSYIGKNAIFSAFDESSMKRFLRDVYITIINWCENNHLRYGIDDLKVGATIRRTVDMIELSIRRSLAGQERTYGYGAVPKEIRYNQDPEIKQRRFFK